MTTHSGEAVAEIFEVKRVLIMPEKFVFLNGAKRRDAAQVLQFCLVAVVSHGNYLVVAV